jgi:hypothetical protein
MVVTIVLVVWVAVIPACVIALAEVVARKRRAARAVASVGDQAGNVVSLAHHARRHARYGAVSRSSSSGSARRPVAPGPRLRVARTRYSGRPFTSS